MSKVFIGLLFLFLDININEMTIIPSFVGYILILAGVRGERECPSGKTTEDIAVAGALVMMFLWLWGLFLGGVPFVGTVFQLLITYRLVLWVGDMTGGGERVDRFRVSWCVLTVGVLLSVALVPLGSGLSLAALVVGLGAAVYYVYTYYRIWKELEAE